MRRGWRAWVSIGLFVAGCGNGCGGSTEERPPTEEGTESPTGGGTTGQAGAEPEVPPGPSPTVRIRGELDPHERAVQPRVESLGPEPAEVGSALGLQRQEGDGWVDVSATLHLRDSCRAAPPDCVTLAPGAVYLPPPWTGQLGDAQCECERCADAPAGTYRFVVHGCGATEPAEGEPFELP